MKGYKSQFQYPMKGNFCLDVLIALEIFLSIWKQFSRCQSMQSTYEDKLGEPHAEPVAVFGMGRPKPK